MELEQRVTELHKTILETREDMRREIEHKSMPKPDDIDSIIVVLKKHGVHRFNLGNMMIEMPWQPEPVGQPVSTSIGQQL